MKYCEQITSLTGETTLKLMKHSELSLIKVSNQCDTPTRQISTSRTNKKCLSVLIQQVVVLEISSQIKISKTCLFDICLLSIFI
jgi:hypothetical protein